VDGGRGSRSGAVRSGPGREESAGPAQRERTGPSSCGRFAEGREGVVGDGWAAEEDGPRRSGGDGGWDEEGDGRDGAIELTSDVHGGSSARTCGTAEKAAVREHLFQI
jgi:hypothetical protein